MLRSQHRSGLYVHIPFCSIKCFYCDFAAFSGQKKTVSRYLAALDREATAHLQTKPPETLYVGGGTPSELSPEEIGELFKIIHARFPQSVFQEATFEANPESLTLEKMKILKDSGVNRISLGLQTLDSELLKSIGRRHTPEDFFSVFAELRKVGEFSVSVDLMYGLPDQSFETHMESLRRLISLKPEHLSLYGLHVEDRTLFSKKKIAVDEDLSRDMFEASLDLLKSEGFFHYEISNFARPGHESLHNKIYWENGDYIGLGCGAASYLSGERRTNDDRLISYCEALEKGREPVASRERLEGKEKLGESVFLGLRLIQGFSPSREIELAFAPQWDSLIQQGLVARVDSKLRLSREGVFLANRVFSEFVPPFDEASIPIPCEAVA
jgi:oxygen-independent coproporphyrinogen-3 oxidase